MPRSIQEIIDHADSPAAQFEAFDEAGAVERPLSEVLLRRAAHARAESEHAVIDTVRAARAEGVPWSRIGELLGTSEQAAQQRYAALLVAS